MPSLTTTVLTASTTLTSYVTVTTGGYLPPNIVGPIEGLAPCSQNIVFESLADSQCNPANFPCICNELQRLGVQTRISTTCSAADTEQYINFQRNVCRNIQPVVPTTTIIVSTTPVPVNVTTSVVPYYNTTTLAPTALVPTIILPTTTSSPEYTGTAAALDVPKFGSMRSVMLAGAMGLMGLVFAEL